jgi:phosphoribosylamine--glycine ligase
VIPRIKSDLLDLFSAVKMQKLDELTIEFEPSTATTVFMVSGGYPGDYQKGIEITGIEQTEGSLVFHAGTKNDGKKIVTDGGRVLAITSLARGIKDALDISYKNAELINFEGKNYRRDLGKDLL